MDMEIDQFIINALVIGNNSLLKQGERYFAKSALIVFKL